MTISGERAGPETLEEAVAKLDPETARELARVLKPKGIHWDGTINTGHVLMIVALVGSGIAAYARQATIDKGQDGSIAENTRRVLVLENSAAETQRNISDMRETLSRIDERTANFAAGLERLERRQEGQ